MHRQAVSRARHLVQPAESQRVDLKSHLPTGGREQHQCAAAVCAGNSKRGGLHVEVFIHDYTVMTFR